MLQVSFFSYKGGAGRTSMLFNTASYLADELGATPDEPIVIIDLDQSMARRASSTPFRC